MKIKVWAQTRSSSCRVKTTIEIDDEDADNVDLIEFQAREAAMEMVDWWYEKEDDEED